MTSTVVFHSWCFSEFKSFLWISPHCCLRSFSHFKQKIWTNNKSELTNWFRRKMKVNCCICVLWRILIETKTKFLNWIRMIWNWNVFFPKNCLNIWLRQIFAYFAATINHLKQLAKCADPIDIYRWCQNKIVYLFGKQ